MILFVTYVMALLWSDKQPHLISNLCDPQFGDDHVGAVVWQGPGKIRIHGDPRWIEGESWYIHQPTCGRVFLLN